MTNHLYIEKGLERKRKESFPVAFFIFAAAAMALFAFAFYVLVLPHNAKAAYQGVKVDGEMLTKEEFCSHE